MAEPIYWFTMGFTAGAVTGLLFVFLWITRSVNDSEGKP